MPCERQGTSRLSCVHDSLPEHRLWFRLDALVDSAPTVLDLLDHRLGAVAARHWRAQGRSLPPAILEEERYSTLATATAPILLQRIASIYPRPIMVLKGP